MGYGTFLGYFIYCFYDDVHSPRSYVHMSLLSQYAIGTALKVPQHSRKGGVLLFYPADLAFTAVYETSTQSIM